MLQDGQAHSIVSFIPAPIVHQFQHNHDRSFFEGPTISSATANPSGTFAVYQESSYSYATHSKRVVLKLLNLTTKEQTVILEDENAAPPAWLSDKEIIWLSERKTGNTQLLVADIDNHKDVRLAGTIVGKASGLKVKTLDNHGVAIAFAAKVNRDGTLWNPIDEREKSHSSARYYTSNYVRHWDSWITEQRNAVFYTFLRREGPSRWEMGRVYNALRSTDEKLECPTPPFGGADDFDIGRKGLVFVAKDPKQDHSMITARDVYFLKTDFRSAADKAEKVSTPGLNGHAGSPCFSDDGSKIVFLKMKHEGAEADKMRPMIIENVSSSLSVKELLQSSDGKGAWSLTPQSVNFLDDKTLILTAWEQSRCPIFVFDTDKPGSELPRKLVQHGGVKHVERLGSGRKLLVTGDSLTDSGYVGMLDIEGGSSKLDMITSAAEHCKNLGISPDQVSDMHFKGDHDRDVHGLVMKPPNFDKNERYPICMLLHGGPQWTFPDSWDDGGPRAQIWAAQGYLVVMPNFTGSVGFGQEFIDAIQNNWGGSPYIDVVKCLDHLEKNVDYADASRAVAGGLSFGGYMANWIQGHDLGRRFKALFTQNGIFSLYSSLATEELFFPRQELGGFPWESEEIRKNWDRWDPSRFAGEWATPHFVVHTDKDFRLGVDHGLAAFNVLQIKGVPSAFLHFHDEGHITSQPENLLVMYNAIFNFVNKYVGLPAAADEVLPLRER